MTTETHLRLLRDARASHRQGTEAITRRQRDRLADMVAFARAHSPYYGEHYRNLPERVTDPTLLPVTSKAQPMPRSDDWVTDPAITFAGVRAFVEDPALIGEKFLGRCTVTTTSGTTGTPGIFLADQRSLAVTTALSARVLGRPAHRPRRRACRGSWWADRHAGSVQSPAELGVGVGDERDRRGMACLAGRPGRPPLVVGRRRRHLPRPLRLRRVPPARRTLGRILAAYGGVFVAGSLAWGILFDGFRPGRWDIIGSAFCILGVAMIMFGPRSNA